MDMDLYEELSLWEQELGFPEDAWKSGLLGNQDGGLLVESDPFWKSDDFPLKEAYRSDLGPSLGIDQESIEDENLLEDWLDEKVDLEDVDEFISSPEFDAVLKDLEDAKLSILDGMDQLIPLSLDNLKQEIASVSSGDDSNSDGGQVVPVKRIKEDSNQETIVVTLNPLNYIEFPSSSRTVPEQESNNDKLITSSPSSSPVLEEQQCIPQTFNLVVVDNPLAIQDADILILEISNDSNGELLQSGSSESQATLPSCSDDSSSRKSAKKSRRKAKASPYARASTSLHNKANSSDDEGSYSSSSANSSDESKVLPPLPNKRERKRSQNRSAATRYRQKKRSELELLGIEEEALSLKNRELTGKVDQLSNEIGYLKGLMKDILIAKGILKKPSKPTLQTLLENP